jgi:poly(A) polymerase
LRILGGVSYVASFENMAKVEAAIGVTACPVRRLGALGVVVSEDAERLWQKLRLTNKEHARLVSMAEGWRRLSASITLDAARVLIYRLGPEAFIDHALLGWARSWQSANDPSWLELATLPQRFAAPVFPLKAADFIKRGIGKGPALGEALRAAESAWAAQGFPESAAALDEIANKTAGGQKT